MAKRPKKDFKIRSRFQTGVGSSSWLQQLSCTLICDCSRRLAWQTLNQSCRNENKLWEKGGEFACFWVHIDSFWHFPFLRLNTLIGHNTWWKCSLVKKYHSFIDDTWYIRWYINWLLMIINDTNLILGLKNCKLFIVSIRRQVLVLTCLM